MKKLIYVGGAICIGSICINITMGQMTPEVEQASKAQVIATLTPATLTLSEKALSKVVHQTVEQPIPDSVYLQLPDSLRGSPLPELLQVDASGHLVINQQIQKLFDYYLNAIGEEPLDLIVARIKHRLASQLVNPAYDHSLEILEGYLQYRNVIGEILADNDNQQTHSVAQISQVRSQIANARDSYLSAEVITAFFGQQDLYDNDVLARQAISSNQRLSAEQKSQAIMTLNQSTPLWLQQQRQSANQLSQFHQQQKQLRLNDADDAQIQQLAEQTFGVEAADRLALLDQKRQQWQVTLGEYHQQLVLLLEGTIADKQTQQQQIALLRRQYFNTFQIRRVDAIDRQKFGI